MAYRLFVGNLPMDIKEKEVEDLFYKYGRMKEVDIKQPPRPPAYAFITFEHEDDAHDAVKGRDGYEFDGSRLRVEFAKGSRGGGPSDRSDRRETRGGRGKRSEWRVIVSRLPKSASWQDLKDFMRKAGDVIYADIDPTGDGVVEYANEEDMEHAIRKLDDSEFKNPFDASYIRVKPANRGRDRDRDRGHDRDRDYRRRSSSRDRNRRSRSRDSVDRKRTSRNDREKDERRDERTKSLSPERDNDGNGKKRNDEEKDKELKDKKDRDDSPRRDSSAGSDRHRRRGRDHSPSHSPSRDRSIGSGRGDDR